jgi:putative addiction module component (TIGR02574 family)
MLGVKPMATTMKELGIDRLSVDERLALVHEIWDSIAAERGPIPLTEAQRAELERRLADHEANPSDVVPWEQIRAEALERFQK